MSSELLWCIFGSLTSDFVCCFHYFDVCWLQEQVIILFERWKCKISVENGIYKLKFSFRAYLKTNIWINNIFECSTLFCLIICSIIAYIQIIELDINPILAKTLDMEDILLLIAIPAFLIESIFSFVPAFKNRALLQMTIALLRVFEVLIQTPFIIDGRRRCSESELKREKKPGRGLVIFLTIANMSLWIYHTFSGKTVYVSDEW